MAPRACAIISVFVCTAQDVGEFGVLWPHSGQSLTAVSEQDTFDPIQPPL